MWTLKKKFRFEASHQLPNHQGKCSRLHGHSWVGWVVCSGVELQPIGSSQGMLMDYGHLSAAVTPIVEAYLDHWHLNMTTGLENPTSEELARFIFNKLEAVMPNLASVIIEETCTSMCEYSR